MNEIAARKRAALLLGSFFYNYTKTGGNLMIIITGASDGIGYQLARLLNESGKTVVNLSLDDCDQARYNYRFDIGIGVDRERALEWLNGITGEPIEALINCAGVMSLDSVENITSAEVERVFRINAEGLISFTIGLIDRIKQDGADIVSIASKAAIRPLKEQVVYGSSKAAVKAFSDNLRIELKDTPCRVMTICPGGVKTGLFAKIGRYDHTNEGSWMSPEDVARFIKQILELPKNMEVSDVVISRK